MKRLVKGALLAAGTALAISAAPAMPAAVATSGKLDPLIAELERRKARTARYRAKRAEARRRECGLVEGRDVG